MELTQFVLDSLPIKRKNSDVKYPDEKRSVDRKPINIEKQSGKTIK